MLIHRVLDFLTIFSHRFLVTRVFFKTVVPDDFICIDNVVLIKISKDGVLGQSSDFELL